VWFLDQYIYRLIHTSGSDFPGARLSSRTPKIRSLGGKGPSRRAATGRRKSKEGRVGRRPKVMIQRTTLNKGASDDTAGMEENSWSSCQRRKKRRGRSMRSGSTPEFRQLLARCPQHYFQPGLIPWNTHAPPPTPLTSVKVKI
jgi:hypothetical protein